jgi:sugar lactone lactonase YvrE
MIAFGGHDLRTLYITGAIQKRSPEELVKFPLSGHVLATQVEVSGLPEHGYMD